jgi:hypothetical protein
MAARMSRVVIEVDGGITIEADIAEGGRLVVSAAKPRNTIGRPRAAPLMITGPGPSPGSGNRHHQGRDIIIAKLRSTGPLNTARLLDALNIDPKDPRRKNLMQLIARMKDEGVLAPIREDRNKPRPRWMVAK